MGKIERIMKQSDSDISIENPEDGRWWRYLDTRELHIFQNKRDDYGLVDISEAKRCPKMKGKRCQKLAKSKEFAAHWETKDTNGRFLYVEVSDLDDSEYEIDHKSGFGFVLGCALVHKGVLLR